MQINLSGKTIFTEDGFCPKEYKNSRKLYKVLYKILGENVYNRKTQIVGAREDEEMITPNFITYIDGLDCLTDSETFLKNFDEECILPKVDGLIWSKKNDINVIGYASYDKIFITVESLDHLKIGLFVLPLDSIEDNFDYFMRVIEKFFLGHVEIKIDAYAESDKERIKKLFNSFSKVGNLYFGEDLSNFELYTEEDGKKNHVISVIL